MTGRRLRSRVRKGKRIFLAFLVPLLRATTWNLMYRGTKKAAENILCLPFFRGGSRQKASNSAKQAKASR